MKSSSNLKNLQANRLVISEWSQVQEEFIKNGIKTILNNRIKKEKIPSNKENSNCDKSNVSIKYFK